MKNSITTLLLLLPGLIHLLPVTGVLGATRLAALYGVAIAEPNLLIMMQHRAVLLGILGIFLMVAAFRSSLQIPAIIAGLISTVSFLVIAIWSGGYNESLQRVLIADVIAIACLLGAAIVLSVKKSKPF
ncbi:MAG: phosphopantetheine adenylyltransferase [Pseudomonadota bacterium]